MKELFKNLDYATIKGVGEDEVLITFNGEDHEIKLTDTTRTPIFEAVDFGDEKFHFDDSSLVLPSKLYGIIIEAFEEHVKDRKEKVDGFWERPRAMQEKSLELDLDK